MILHTLSAGPDGNAFSECLRMLSTDDAVLLTGDGVYCSIADTKACNHLLESGAELYVLESDARAAGVHERVCEQAKLIDYDGFVTLSERFAQQLAWY